MVTRFDNITKEMIKEVVKNKSLWKKNSNNIFVLKNSKGRDIIRGIKLLENTDELYSSVHIVKKIIEIYGLDIKGDINPDSCEPAISRIMESKTTTNSNSKKSVNNSSNDSTKKNNSETNYETTCEEETNPNVEKPILDENVKYIIIGTFPPKSAYHGDNNFSYYDSGDNLCWKIFQEIYKDDEKYKEVLQKYNLKDSLSGNYEAKKEFLLSKNIGMIDIVETTKRKNISSGSDSELIPVELTDIKKQLKKLKKYNSGELKLLMSKTVKDEFFTKKNKLDDLNNTIKIVPSFSRAAGAGGDFGYFKYKKGGLKHNYFIEYLKYKELLSEDFKEYLDDKLKSDPKNNIDINIRAFEFSKVFNLPPFNKTS
ncbi:MAG: hypothetical protein ACLFPL_03075 [Candidatus Nanoarchaeia archaeon]